MNIETTTLFGGKRVTVTFDVASDNGQVTGNPDTSPTSPVTQEIRVRQIPLRDYERGFALGNDEIALVGFLCQPVTSGTGQVPGNPATRHPSPVTCFDRQWALSLTPASYETVLAAGREVNAGGFFAFAGRRAAEQAEKEQAAMAVGLQLAREHPELLEAALRQPSVWKGPSPASPPRPAA